MQGMKLNFDLGGVGGRRRNLSEPMYVGKSEIPVGKSNGLHYFVWEPSENICCDFRQCNFSTLFSLFSTFGYTL